MFLGSKVRPVRKADNLAAMCGNEGYLISDICYGDSLIF
jgi:hypothetical protein